MLPFNIIMCSIAVVWKIEIHRNDVPLDFLGIFNYLWVLRVTMLYHLVLGILFLCILAGVLTEARTPKSYAFSKWTVPHTIIKYALFINLIVHLGFKCIDKEELKFDGRDMWVFTLFFLHGGHTGDYEILTKKPEK